MTLTGLERVVSAPELLKGAGRLGLLYHQASVDSQYRNAPDLIHRRFPGRLRTLFGPQHGADATEQDNMRETPHGVHPRLGLPIYSLYGESRRPAPDTLDDIDTVLVDLQDVGTRVYTYATTALYVMEACASADKAMVVLDRPNPINGLDVEGNLLEDDCRSFVGPHPIPMRHGLTLGELMLYYNDVRSVHCRLTVIPMSAWDRSFFFEETGLPWTPPSPNMPLVETAVVYPGQVALEGTNLSEGRGTVRPFETFGAPFMDPEELLDHISPEMRRGLAIRRISFRPTFHKWAGEACRGFQIHVVSRRSFRPYRFTLAVLAASLKLYPALFNWSSPPYEYVADRLPIDVILGGSTVRSDLGAGRSVLDMEAEWSRDLEEFQRRRSEYFLY
jgi:uncharacterized protein YbbC (DUF1343 family)